jgi:hypothetical protein
VVREATPIDIGAVPELAHLVDMVTRTRRPQAIQRDGETLALLVPAGRRSRRRVRTTLVDTSSLPPLRYHSLKELLQDREPPPPRPFTSEEMKAAIARERAEAWRAKNS